MKILKRETLAPWLIISVLAVGTWFETRQWANAEPQSGTTTQTSHRVELLDAKGNAYPIGSLDLLESGSGYSYRFELDHHRFTDHFLSMKEMKCLEGAELWCYIPYPYDNPKQISQDDLRWLEHDLLFLFKRTGEFGANFWNGIYYKLEMDEQGNIQGQAHAIDLNLLASPPADLAVPPLTDADIEEADLGKRWLPGITITLN